VRNENETLAPHSFVQAFKANEPRSASAVHRQTRRRPRSPQAPS
jgi:hypothetical protein